MRIRGSVRCFGVKVDLTRRSAILMTLSYYYVLLSTFAPLVLSVWAEPAASEAISCLTHAPGGDSTAVSPQSYTHEQGYDVCIKYQRLSGNQWVWEYGATSSAKCAQMMHQSQQYKNVQCCMQPNCNTPDAVLNPNTRIVQPTQLNDGSRTTAAAGQQLAAKHRRVLSFSSTQHSLAVRSGLRSITCYRNVPTKLLQAGHQAAVAPRTYRRTDRSELCARYTYKCAEEDRACSTEDVLTGVWKWMYAPLPVSMCLELKGSGRAADALIKHVRCCSGALCNRPDGVLDTTTTVLRSAPSAAPPAAAGKDKSTAIAAISRGAALHRLTSSQTTSSRISARLACYTSLARVGGQQAAVVIKAYNRRTDGVDVCSRYQIRCISDKISSCTAADVSSNAWIWEYKVLDRPTCRETQAIAAAGERSGYRHVICCSSSNCNKPDQTLDKDTVVQADVAAGAADVGVGAGAAAGGAPALSAAVAVLANHNPRNANYMT